MNKELSSPEYWDDRYNNRSDIWSLNTPNPVLVQALEQKNIISPARILVAGCGKGEDAIYLAKSGFEVTAIDFSAEAVSAALMNSRKENAVLEIIRGDLFNLKNEFAGVFDYIYEYVTLCAIDQARIEELIENISSALKPGGHFITVPFPIDGRAGGPPFALDFVMLYKIISKYLKLEFYAKNINSVKPRKGKEVLMIFKKEN